ncbi:GNAT family N-acetyltransferase [Dactylosporangium sp. NPDC000521]|uniref:GNAT family N-acetyltransferase n=1 Tax=Dactylosporangium sp. NPDC000521 TaxID=3363975 RepID=UPI0036885953
MTSTSTAPAVRVAGAGDVATVAGVLAAALDDTDIAHWLVPDRDERVEVYRRYFDLVTPWFVEHGTVHMTADGAAVAAWVRLDGKFEPEIADYDRRLAEACGEATGRFVRLDEDMLAAHPDGLAHDYLAFLGVAPGRQSQGLGSLLLREHHRITDADGLPAYLEATGRRNAALYARHGYADTRPVHIGDGPPLYAMLRPAAAQATPSAVASHMP